MAGCGVGIYKCIYDFNAETEHDLQLLKGDLVKVTDQINAEWLHGHNQQNIYGQFPLNFVTPVLKDTVVDRVGIVLSNFVAEQQQDLPLCKDDVVGIERNIDSNWLYGFDRHGRQGIFPTTFIREVCFTATANTANDAHDHYRPGYDPNNNKEDSFNSNDPKPMAKVVDAFQAQEDDELSINVGDEIILTREIDGFWIEGILNGRQGKFPKMYVNVIRELPNNLKYVEEENNKNSKDSTTPVPKARAMFMFVGTQDDDLSFDKGDVIQLTQRINREWLVGKIGNTIGKFPANYVDVIVDLPFSANSYTSPTTTDAVRNTTKNSTTPSTQSHSKQNVAPNTAQSTVNSTHSNTQSYPKDKTVPSADKVQNKKVSSVDRARHAQRPTQRVKTKIVASNIPPPIDVKKSLSNPTSPTHDSSVSPRNNNSVSPPNHSPFSASNPSTVAPSNNLHANTVATRTSGSVSREADTTAKVPSPQNGVAHRQQNGVVPTLNGPQRKPSLKEKPVIVSEQNQISPSKDKARKSSFREKHSTKLVSPHKESTVGSKPPVSGGGGKSNTLSVSPTKEHRKFSIGKKKPPPPPKLPHRFELVEEKIFDMYSNPSSNKHHKASTLPRRVGRSQPPPQDYPSPSPSANAKPKLPKPLAPMPATQRIERPVSLNLDNGGNNPRKDSQQTSPLSPISVVHSESFSVSFKKQENSNSAALLLPRSETDPVISKNLTLTQQEQQNQAAKFQKQRPKSLYFASSGSPSPEKRSLTLNAVLQRSSSMRGSNSELPRKISATTPNASGYNIDSVSHNSNELKRIDTEIAELKSKIEAEAHLLSGVETLLDFVAEEKKADLITKQEQHNANIGELNDDLNALEDQKSYVLASLGKVDDVLHRVTELEKQIEMYLDNCEQLRRMQDVAVIEELPEIRDSIEFCENMVDTLQDELNGLKEKLGEMGELNEEDGDSVNMEEMLAKKQKNQMKVVEELINTERAYHNHITELLETMNNIENMENEEKDISTDVLFGNLPDIVELSSKLLQQFDTINLDGTSEDILKKVSTAFVTLSTEMKDCYATYCRNYDDAQMLKEKYEEDPVLWSHIASAINSASSAEEGFNLGSYLIKPVQRVLKYPLLLNELYKNQVDGCSSKIDLKIALDTVTDVATAINEFKRRKDLVLKYRETEDGLGKRVQKLNWHSVAKKSSRINQKITQFTGLNSQTVDDNFIEEEKKFRALEKLIKTTLKNILQFVEEFKENSAFQKQCAESLHQMLEGEEAHEEIINYYNKISQITDLYTTQMLTFIKDNVTDPLSQLLQLFPAPFRLIQKRNDKCLDYDRAKNKAQRARDSRERDKINQTEQELQMCENVYTALNSQLLEELPSLSQKCSSFLIYCIQNFTEARKRYFTKAHSELHTLWQLPFIKKDCDLYEWHRESINKATEQLASLTFVPSIANKDLNRRNQPSSNDQQTNNNRTTFFFDIDNSGPKSPSSQPLIDLNADDGTADGDIDDSDLLVSTSSSNLPPVEFSNNGVLVPEKLSEVPAAASIDNNRQEPPVVSRYIVKYDFQAEHSSELSVLEGVVVNVLRRCDTSGNSEWWLVEYGGNKGYIPESFLEPYPSNEKADVKTEQSRMSSGTVFYDENSLKYNTLPNTITLTSTNHNNSTKHTTVGNSAFYNSNSIVNDDTADTTSRTSNDNDNLSSYSVDDSQSEKSLNMMSESTTNSSYVLEYDFEALNAGELSAKEGQIVNCLYKHDQKGNPEWWYVEYDGQRGYIPRDYLSICENTQMC